MNLRKPPKDHYLIRTPSDRRRAVTKRPGDLVWCEADGGWMPPLFRHGRLMPGFIYARPRKRHAK
jgi:hypothetical protein